MIRLQNRNGNNETKSVYEEFNYQFKNIKKGFDPIFIHGVDILLHPFPQNQVQLKIPSLLAPIQQPNFK